MIYILAPHHKVGEVIAREIADREQWPLYAAGRSHRFVNPGNVEDSLRGLRGITLVVATTSRPEHLRGPGWRSRQWNNALNWLYTTANVYQLSIVFHSLR